MTTPTNPRTALKQPQIDPQLVAAYRKARAWHFESYGLSGVHLQDGNGGYRSARQFVGGGAAYQMHALAAYWSARRSIAFRKDFAATIAASKKRSKAAKRGWATRRQGAAA